MGGNLLRRPAVYLSYALETVPEIPDFPCESARSIDRSRESCVESQLCGIAGLLRELHEILHPNGSVAVVAAIATATCRLEYPATRWSIFLAKGVSHFETWGHEKTETETKMRPQIHRETARY